jgi:arginine-tRNA-protein transferase
LVKQEERLVAFTVFFEGEKSLASIVAAYDLEFSKFSLGFFTMLLEQKYGEASGKEYYYPGILAKGEPKFQYKTRLGGLEFFQLKNRQWRPVEEFKAEDWIYDYMKSNILDILVRSLDRTGLNRPTLLYEFVKPGSKEAEGLGLWGFLPSLSYLKPGGETRVFFHPFTEEYILINEPKTLNKEGNFRTLQFFRTKLEKEAVEAMTF